MLQGPGEDWGTMKCSCHPNCGVGAALMVSKKTKKWVPLTKLVNTDRLLGDARRIVDAGAGLR